MSTCTHVYISTFYNVTDITILFLTQGCMFYSAPRLMSYSVILTRAMRIHIMIKHKYMHICMHTYRY